RAVVLELDSGREHLFSARYACPVCDYSLPELEPRLFSFNNPMGACPECDGLGTITFFDPRRVVAHPGLSLASGAIKGWDRRNQFYFQMLTSLAAHFRFDVEAPFEKLPEPVQTLVLHGTQEKIPFSYLSERGRTLVKEHAFEGILPSLERRYKETDSLVVREELAKYLNTKACPSCGGTRLRPEARHVKIDGRAIFEVSACPMKQALEFFRRLELSGGKQAIAEKIVNEIIARLNFLNNVGLDYLSLDRAADTLSGGEAQRIRLASQIGSGLTGVMYVLDEPSIGLHQRDNARLLATLKHLRDIGNTVIVDEHDDKAVSVDQSPIGRTPRSNPATYTALFTPIRELFAGVPMARERGYGPGRFSFNVKGGRCEACQGDGVIKVEMHFLPDIYVPCDTCHGKRYNRETLEVQFKGKNIHEVLQMTVEAAYEFFNAVPAVERKLQTLLEV